MRSRRYKYSRKNKTRKMIGGKKWGGKTGKKWTTAISAAQKTLRATGSLQAAKKSLRKQALTNARKLFGSVGSM
jgi:hypothetical protein